jgi:cobyric acid synthase
VLEEPEAAEININAGDTVNMGMARMAGAPLLW